MAVFSAAEVTATPVYEIDQLVADEHIQARGVIVEAPDAEAGSVLMHNVIPRLSETPGKLRRPAPALGEHTRELLKAIGYSEEQIGGFIAEGAARQA
jgi:crotonobetainyl-CoA:carnitine CoA-transferase CaiB-like acyl-CoA transferase